MITLAKNNDLPSTKKLIATLPQKMAVMKAIEVLRERYKTRVGGYTRIIKLSPRPGDGAHMVQLELV
jgi:large subunit ribosomal protein L17